VYIYGNKLSFCYIILWSAVFFFRCTCICNAMTTVHVLIIHTWPLAECDSGRKTRKQRCDEIRIWQVFQLLAFSTDSKFDECFKRCVVECECIEKSLFCDWFHMHREPKSVDTLFLEYNPHKLQLLNVQHNFCSVMCNTILIWTLILLTLENNILLQSVNWPKENSVH